MDIEKIILDSTGVSKEEYVRKLDEAFSSLIIFGRCKIEFNKTHMNFGQAIEALKAGQAVSRQGWNGKGMYLQLVKSIHSIPEGGYAGPVYRLTVEPKYEALPYIGMKTTDDKFVPWLASQTDMLAEDWDVLPATA